jgi:hypothetical protein
MRPDVRIVARAVVSAVLIVTGAATPARAELGDVLLEQKISDTTGDFEGVIDPGDAFGFCVESLGDFNGDGTPDVVVGAPGDDGVVGADEGSFWVVFLKPNGKVKRYEKFAPGTGPLAAPGSQLGRDLANAGDVDDDGNVDVAVGAPFSAEGAVDRGIVWTVFLDDDGSFKDVMRFDGFGSDFDGDLDAGDHFGEGIAGIGDLDGDGVPDLAVGAPGDDDDDRDGVNQGAVWILLMTREGLVDGYQKINLDEGGFAGELETDDAFGASVATIGDLDGDGVVDLAVGAPFDDDGNGEDLGAVWILFLKNDGTVKGEYKISKRDDHLLAELDELDLFGWDVDGIGDFDEDGVPDIAVSAPNDDDGDGQDRGAFYLLFLNPDGSVKAEKKISDNAGGFDGNLDPGDWFGNSVAALGDLDGDGTSEIAAGTPGTDDGAGADTGAVWNLFLEGPQVLCGDADSSGAVSSTDALIALNAAVGLAVCESCLCDVNASGGITASDAQTLLAAAVGLPADLTCPACG